MRDVRPLLATSVMFLCVGLAAGSAGASGFALIDNFESYLPGDIDGQGDWDALGGAYIVVADPESPSNAVLRAEVSSDEARRPLVISDGETQTFFLRLRIGAQQNISFGLSDRFGPTEIHDFEVELNLANAGLELRANDGGTYQVITTLTPHRWYNVWVLVDNAADRFDVYLHDRGFTGAEPGDRVAASLVFRNGGAGDLRSLYLKTGGGSSQSQGPLYTDDIYLGTGLDLSNPADNPADWDGDGAVDVFDLLAYLADWFAQAPAADLTGDAAVDVFDLLDYLGHWFAA